MNHTSFSSLVMPVLPAIDLRWLSLSRPFVGVAPHAFALVVAEDGVAVAVLNAIDQCRFHPPSAIVEHRIGGDHAQNRRLASAKRIGKVRREIVIDAETLGI